MLLENMTMADFKRNIKKTKTIIIPFGTVEEHGSHLPLNTDTLIAYEVLKKVVKKRKAFLSPPVYYGVCTTTGGHPGTLSISPGTLRGITRDLIADAYRKGFRKIFLITGHGGGLHTSAMKEAAEELIGGLKGTKLAVLCPYDLLYRELAEIADTPNDSHAGEIETSLVLALAPDLAKGRAKEDYPKIPKPFVVKDKVRYWKSGVWGDPGKASVEKGRKAVRLIVNKIVEVMDMA